MTQGRVLAVSNLPSHSSPGRITHGVLYFLSISYYQRQRAPGRGPPFQGPRLCGSSHTSLSTRGRLPVNFSLQFNVNCSTEKSFPEISFVPPLLNQDDALHLPPTEEISNTAATYPLGTGLPDRLTRPWSVKSRNRT